MNEKNYRGHATGYWKEDYGGRIFHVGYYDDGVRIGIWKGYCKVTNRITQKTQYGWRKVLFSWYHTDSYISYNINLFKEIHKEEIYE